MTRLVRISYVVRNPYDCTENRSLSLLLVSVSVSVSVSSLLSSYRHGVVLVVSFRSSRNTVVVSQSCINLQTSQSHGARPISYWCDEHTPTVVYLILVDSEFWICTSIEARNQKQVSADDIACFCCFCGSFEPFFVRFENLFFI